MKTNVSSALPDTELEIYIQDWHYDDALASYRATWRKLEKYIDSLGYEK